MVETKNGIETFYAPTNKEWREWLSEKGHSEKSVWLIIYHKNSQTPSIEYHESIEDALCFGWIDSKAIKRDEESFYLYFTKRKPKSNWSKINKERVAKLTEQGLMTPAGQVYIDLAKENGTWDFDDDIIPEDLQKLLDNNEIALKNFQAFSPSSKRLILQWIMMAKKAETRLQRIIQTVELAEKNMKANHPIPKN